MITKEQAYDIIFNLNEQAHELAWDNWVLADEEEDEEIAETLREDASIVQQGHFQELFYDTLDDDVQEDIWHYASTDKTFEEDFLGWFGDE